MEFYSKQLFHIYNQGNNRRKIFFSDGNYEYFLWKMRAYLLPFGDLVAYCLMPNHFHWLFFVKRVEVSRITFDHHLIKVKKLQFPNRFEAPPSTPPKNRGKPKKLTVTLNQSIGFLQKSYTQAINKQRNYSGSLFRSRCKAKDGWIDGINHKSNKSNYPFQSGHHYAYQCLCYIHENPVKAKLVKEAVDWEFSSARDYAGVRKGSLCNVEMGKEILKWV